MTYPNGPTSWSQPPDPAGPPPAPAPVSSGTGQVYSSSYLRQPVEEPPRYPPAYEAQDPQGYGDQAYSSEPQPYGARVDDPSLFGLRFDSQQYGDSQQYSDSQYGDSPQSGQGYGGDQTYADPYGAPYEQTYVSPPEKSEPTSRFAAIPKTALLGAICVALLLASAILLTMYVKQAGKTDDTAGELRTVQQELKQRDDKIKQLDGQLTEAEKKAGTNSDQLTTLQSDLQKARQDLDTANKDKTSLTTCLQALTKASAERDPVKQAQLAQASRQTCAKGFQLSGIQAG